MKQKLLLLFFAIGIANVLWAQEPYRGLVISEASMTDYIIYFEITNMGESGIDLREIKFGQSWPQSQTLVFDPWNDPWEPNGRYFYLPESVSKVLQPGESFAMTLARDFGLNMYNARIPNYGGTDRQANHDIKQYADFLIHYPEKNADELILYPHIKDSVLQDSIYTYNAHHTLSYANLPQCGFYIEHHFTEGDSAVIDQVGNMLDNNGRNSSALYDVAGVQNGGTIALLVRKPIIKQGNADFANSKGVGLEDSEWMALKYPDGLDNWRDIWWTIGNQGDYMLDATTLEPKSDNFSVDFGTKTISVPWGTRRLDDIMRNMKHKPGVAWVYHLNETVEDSLLRSAQNGDKLSIYVFGTTLYTETFDIAVKEPTQDVNIVVPIDHVNQENLLTGGPISNNVQNGKLGWPRVTNHKNGTDTITGNGYGLPNALRTDSLLKYLEKPANAGWEFVFVDGDKRADLKNGDKLKVTAQNGAIKEYFIEVQSYNANHNANLSSITWPDIPEFYYGLFGWKGDTIPNFNSYGYNYKITVPADVDGIPALVAKTENLNANIVVKRATTFSGTTDDRTITFTVTAEDDSVINIYTIELVKEKDLSKIQPYAAEPFISEVSWGVVEIYNPGNQPLDLSNYLISSARFGGTVPDVITSGMGVGDWNNRYRKYVPGYKWLSQLDWEITPGILQSDINVYPIVMPGEVFTVGAIKKDPFLMDILDVQLYNSDIYPEIINPWNEFVSPGGLIAVPYAPVHNLFLFKILNDSVKLGLKPANDPYDFELIDVMGNADGSRNWNIAGGASWDRLFRKPNVYHGNPLMGASFGTTPEDSEWMFERGGYKYGNTGFHFMNEITFYMSTVNSKAYKVSKGYSLNESISGIVTGTTVSDFMANLYKADEGQALKVKSFADGSELNMDAMLSLNDTLVVLSADSTNTTKYVLNVAEVGLGSDAVLTSSRYDITIESEPKSATDENAGTGTVKGLEYGTTLKSVLGGINVPSGAVLTVIDGNGAFVPLKVLNFDTTYVNVTVNNNIYFEVVAENGITTIIYQLIPETSANDAFITSDVYNVVQKDILVQYVPRGTSVQSLIGNLVASDGATIKLVDKLGMERLAGTIFEDDKIVVTSPNGFNTKVYFISMLATQYVPKTTYLAYIQSPFYNIDQVGYKVNGVSGTETIPDFLSKVKASQGATAVVVDENGIVKTTGDIDNGDIVMVTSADGKMIVYYTFGILTATNVYESNGIELYPNPNNGTINISGVNAGNRIQIYNSVGAIIRDVNVQKSIETISLHNQPAGMYMIVISDQNKMLGRYKALRK